MKHFHLIILTIYFIFSIVCTEESFGQAKRTEAFPGAEGGGRYTTGGRGGKVIYVTSLEDNDNPGTLRWAVTRDYPRTVVFKVSGVIFLEKRLKITGDNITIAGQTAPGDGICIAGNGVTINADNVIIRYLRFRTGDYGAAKASQEDALGSRYHKNLIIDHCSMSWSTDECGSFYANENFTLQWCILSESLKNSLHEKGSHGYGGIWGGKNASFHHNLLSCHESRNPRFDHPLIYLPNVTLEEFRGNVDFRNNVIYNWGHQSSYGGEGGRFNMIGNYYKPGPATSPKTLDRFITVYGRTPDLHNKKEKVYYESPYPDLYMEGNILEGNKEISSDNYAGVKYASTGGEKGRFLKEPLTINGKKENHTGTQTASEAFQLVCASAGASLYRDAIDRRIIKDALNGTATCNDGGNGSTGGHIDTQAAVGGLPVYRSTAAPADSDGDGMPDKWEMEHKLNPEDPSDGAAIDRKSGYSFLEIYLNDLVSTGQQTTEEDIPGNKEDEVRSALRKATDYIYDKVSNNGGFLWNYSEDLSRKWGELQAYDSMVWVERYTPAVGQLMIDLYHITNDEYYYDRACQTADVLVRGQLACGGWNYKFDLDGPASEQKWYNTVGKNAWGASEHSFYYGNATFDDNVTAGATDFLVRLYAEKYDSRFKYAVDKAVNMILESQFENGGWPQRWPLMYNHPNNDGTPDYTSCITLNDDILNHNVDLLMKVYFVLGDERAQKAIFKAMSCLKNLQYRKPAAGWADQYYHNLEPARARDFEPSAISSTRTSDSIVQLIEYFYLTGDDSFLEGIPDAIEFLESIRLSEKDLEIYGKTPEKGKIFCPRFVNPQTCKPLYLHRKGTHVNNGHYYADENLNNTIKHYASVASINIDGLWQKYRKAKDTDKLQIISDSPFYGNRAMKYDRFFTNGLKRFNEPDFLRALNSLDENGRWLSKLDWALMPYIGEGSPEDPAPEEYSDTEWSPYNTAAKIKEDIYGISMKEYINNMAALAAFLLNNDNKQ